MYAAMTQDEKWQMQYEQMMDFINEYEYEDTEVYFYIRKFTFE